jgi:hypothetical protein
MKGAGFYWLMGRVWTIVKTHTDDENHAIRRFSG